MLPKNEPRLPGGVIYSNGGYDRQLAKDSVGKGWSGLIDEVFDRLEALGKPISIVQVKEKYAGLRIYIGASYVDDEQKVNELEKLIRDVEYKSLKICDVCGKEGKVRGKGWYYTSCDEHARAGDSEPHKYQPGDHDAEEN